MSGEEPFGRGLDGEEWRWGPLPPPKGWAAIADEARRRILTRAWAPGATIPSEADLAREWGASRATVNRALQRLAEEGLLIRRRRAGTKVAPRLRNPATFDVPLIREEVERSGAVYGYELVEAGEHAPPPDVRQRLMVRGRPRVMRVLARHLAGGRPLAWEERWINGGTVPEALHVDWRRRSPNEWLLEHVPYTEVEVAIGAAEAGPLSGKALGCEVGAPLLTLERTTFQGAFSVTFVRFCYRPGYQIWSRG